MRLAIIGGTGVKREQLLSEVKDKTIRTPFGEAHVLEGRVGATDVLFLSRHGAGHKLPPHAINYRANIWALREMGCQAIVATAAVGSLRTAWEPGTFVIVDSFLDFTHGRASTFFTGEDGRVVHQDMTYPYCETLRNILLHAARQQQAPVREHGCYVCTNGPRYETAAEVRAFALLGGDIVGMTGIPEVVLARELGLCYATVALVTNLGAGLQPNRLMHQDVETLMRQSAPVLTTILENSIPAIAQTECHSC
ncbi:MAG TPA: S-methyl-5'-thioinosine phosphorylase [Firmicutes bacterium]|nr:S-methyl-5'-thioinosine phosphorylase [Bacillota bacterium]